MCLNGLLMSKNPLPGEDHFARYCPPKTAPEGQPSPTSFMLRDKKDNSLSINWMEYYGGNDRLIQIAEIRENIELKLASTGVFAILNVGNVVDTIDAEYKKKLEILHDPTDVDPSHSGIYGYGCEDLHIATMIAELVLETHPSRLG